MENLGDYNIDDVDNRNRFGERLLEFLDNVNLVLDM